MPISNFQLFFFNDNVHLLFWDSLSLIRINSRSTAVKLNVNYWGAHSSVWGCDLKCPHRWEQLGVTTEPPPYLECVVRPERISILVWKTVFPALLVQLLCANLEQKRRWACSLLFSALQLKYAARGLWLRRGKQVRGPGRWCRPVRFDDGNSNSAGEKKEEKGGCRQEKQEETRSKGDSEGQTLPHRLSRTWRSSRLAYTLTISYTHRCARTASKMCLCFRQHNSVLNYRISFNFFPT